MKKKERKKIEKLIRAESRTIRRDVITQNRITRKNTNETSKCISSDCDYIIKLLKELMDHRAGQIVPSTCVEEIKHFPAVNLSKKERKKIIKHFTKYIDIELKCICESLVNYCHQEIHQEIAKGLSDSKPSISKATAYKVPCTIEEFCKDVLKLPPEYILGPDYKDKFESGDEKEEKHKDDGEEDNTPDDIGEAEIDEEKN